MSKLIGVLIILLLIFGGYKLFRYWDQVSREQDHPKVELTGELLKGLGSPLAQSYQQISKAGAPALKKWLDENAASPDLQDPRKAWIQLDYVVMVARENPAEAKRVFAQVKARVDASSPVAPRLKKLAPTYE